MWLIQPIQLEEYNLHKCDGAFTGIPFLRQRDDSYLLKPEEACYIGTSLDGQRSFIPVSTVSSKGLFVLDDLKGQVNLTLSLPED
jgi:hypothetical protein